MTVGPAVAASVLVLLSAALAVWPSGRAARRVRGVAGAEASSRGGGGAAGLTSWWVLGIPPTVGALIGVAAGIASGIVAAVWISRARRRAAERRAAADEALLRRALAVMVAEMSVGAPMVSACRAAAEEVGVGPDESGRGVAGELGRIAAHVELGGELDAVQPAVPGMARICEAWSTSVRHGLPMAALLEAVRRDLAQRREFLARTEASLAGPRATAMVLAGLPLLGIGLGQLMGAHPLGVLFGSPLGGILLVVGVALAAAGVLWADAIVAKVLR